MKPLYRPIKVVFSNASTQIANATYVGWVYKNATSAFTVSLYNASTSIFRKRYLVGTYYQGTWTWDNLVLKSQIEENPIFKVFSIDNNGVRFFISHHSRIIIDVLTSNANRCGSLFVYCSDPGDISVSKVGADGITYSTATGDPYSTLILTGACTAYTRIYDGNIFIPE